MRYPSAPASLIDPSGSFYQAYAEAYGSPSPCGGLSRRTGEREDRCTQSAGGVDSTRFAAKLKNPTCVDDSGWSFGHHRELVAVRICVGRGRAHRCQFRVFGTPQLARTFFRSAASPADASSLRGGFLPALRCWLKILRAVKVARHLLPVRFHSAFAVCQDLAHRSVEQSFHGFMSLLLDVGNHVRRMRQSAVKE
jgi:hypothetical protein